MPMALPTTGVDVDDEDLFLGADKYRASATPWETRARNPHFDDGLTHELPVAETGAGTTVRVRVVRRVACRCAKSFT